MRRLIRPPRIVALCVRGDTAKHIRDNIGRIALFNDIARALSEADWHPIEAVLFPGGFFRMSKAFGASSFEQRHEAVRNEPFAIAVSAAVGRLKVRSPGIHIVTGVLATPSDPTERTEQACLALGANGLVSVARKIFPTSADTKGKRFVSPFADDYTSPHRLLPLANGSLAALGACYDLFGVADLEGGSGGRRTAIRRILTREGRVVVGDDGFTAYRRSRIDAFFDLLRERNPDVALAAVHRFQAPGQDGYWQRHGIARASASLGGGLVVGAAHFLDRLPAANASTLAAHGVEHEHILAGTRRLALRLAPVAAMAIKTASGEGILRLFTPPPTLQIRGERL